MERVTEIKRTITYLGDIISDLSLTGTQKSKILYSQLFRNYREAQAYLLRFSTGDPELEGLVARLPSLVPSNIFNVQLEGMLLVVIPGCVIPFFAVALILLTAPVSIPYFIIRVVVLRKTKSRIWEAKVTLTQLVNKLRERQENL
jgi:hypothetical protein